MCFLFWYALDLSVRQKLKINLSSLNDLQMFVDGKMFFYEWRKTWTQSEGVFYLVKVLEILYIIYVNTS